MARKKEKCVSKLNVDSADENSYVQSQIDDAVGLLVDYANTDESERDPENAISELSAIEEALDEEADDAGWNGYWEAVEAISFFANQLGIDWASPYSYCVVRGDDTVDSVGHLQTYQDDLETIRKVAKLRNVFMPEIVREFAKSLRKKYAKELTLTKTDREKKSHKRK